MCIRGEKGGTAAVDELFSFVFVFFLAAISGGCLGYNFCCALSEAKTA